MTRRRAAALTATYPGTVLVLGDNAYEDGSRSDYQDCYQPSWGHLLDRTLAVPGNHDHQTADAKGYFDYFGARAGPDKRGWATPPDARRMAPHHAGLGMQRGRRL